MKIRIKFEKFGTICYIGHLDIMRYFHKALQRAHIDVSFSTGFHPHPIMSFASPLGVGLSSCGEYMDVEVGSVRPGQAMLDAINAEMVDGMRVTGVRLLPEEGRKNNAMATVGQADYRVWVPALIGEDYRATSGALYEPKKVTYLTSTGEACMTEGSDSSYDPAYDAVGRTAAAITMADRDWSADVEHFLASEEILIHKKTKKSETDVNIRDWILKFAYEPDSQSFFLRLTAGSMNNLKPELMMDAFFRYLGIDLDGSRMTLDICRLDMLTEDGVSLGELGEEIL